MRRKKLSATETLPRIIMFLAFTDFGPFDDAGDPPTLCPHCGAEGRYVWSFKCDDGTTRGAMNGCVQLFPKHRFALVSQRIIKKAAEYKAKKWNLPSWDEQIKKALDQFVAGEITEQVCGWQIESAEKCRKSYRKRKYSMSY